MEDSIEVSEDFLENASEPQLAELAKQLGVLVNDTRMTGDSLRALLKRQQLRI